MTKKTKAKAEKKQKAKKEDQPAASDRDFTLDIGGYGHEHSAKLACGEYMHPGIFRYQAPYFPRPEDYGVTAKITNAVPLKLEKPATPLYPYAVIITLHVEGPDDKCKQWRDALEARNRARMVAR
jgi:hypothetical protein